MPGNVLCVFGTGSDVGKSWIAAGLCRLFRQDGVDVAPYKAQNMSNNAGVTPDGLELGRAQIVQAHACGLVPTVDMNPLLLKPDSDTGAQVVALGRVLGTVSARDYFSGSMEDRRGLVTDALDRLRARHALVVAEGAGSCAEVNLRDRDLVNLPIAHHADGRVLLVADIDKGGVFAQVVGTLEVLSEQDRARISGVVVNRFRGDASLFEDGRAWLEERTGVPVVGVVPWAHHIQIELEDGLSPSVTMDPPPPSGSGLRAAVIRLPHIANFTDFDALERHGVELAYLQRPRDLAPYDVVFLPGTKNTRGDLAWLRDTGWDERLAAYGGQLFGLCGGYQMLGRWIDDPHGVEGEPGRTAGLGLLPVTTVMAAEKTTRRVTGTYGDVAVQGYEIHVGRTEVDGEPLLSLEGRPEGCRAGSVAGTYLHGLFDGDGVVEALLGPVRPELAWPRVPSHATWREAQLDALADHLRGCLDVPLLRRLAGIAPPSP